MFTIFDALRWLLALLGLCIGVGSGAAFGVLEALGGGVIGCVVGWQLGRLLLVAARCWMLVDLRWRRTSSLRESLREPMMWPAFGFYLAELVRRGERIEPDLPIVVDLLGSSDLRCRWHGWVLLNRHFPDRATQIPDFRPDGPDELRGPIIARLGRSERP
jgi:hypothetical protein